MKIEQFMENRKIGRNFLFRLLHKAKFIYLLLVLIISVGLSGWSVESRSVRIPIIGFHDIVDIQNPADLPPRRLAFENDYTKQKLSVFLEYLFKQKYWFLSAQDLYVYFIKKSQPIPPEHLGHKPIMLSFDDGYEGVHKNGLPLLEKLSSLHKENGKFVLFVNPLFLGVDMGGDFLPHTSCNDLRTGYQKGFYDVQSHGFSHKRLTRLSGQD
jgi:poly-beta-1,6-N-acetyl-D-glucosamine N-deacetylase